MSGAPDSSAPDSAAPDDTSGSVPSGTAPDDTMGSVASDDAAVVARWSAASAAARALLDGPATPDRSRQVRWTTLGAVAAVVVAVALALLGVPEPVRWAVVVAFFVVGALLVAAEIVRTRRRAPVPLVTAVLDRREQAAVGRAVDGTATAPAAGTDVVRAAARQRLEARGLLASAGAVLACAAMTVVQGPFFLVYGAVGVLSAVALVAQWYGVVRAERFLRQDEPARSTN